jgi:hypothetical protein
MPSNIDLRNYLMSNNLQKPMSVNPMSPANIPVFDQYKKPVPAPKNKVKAGKLNIDYTKPIGENVFVDPLAMTIDNKLKGGQGGNKPLVPPTPSMGDMTGLAESSPLSPNEEPKSDNDFLAHLIGQGAAMFGAGIAGRDPGQVANQFEGMRQSRDQMISSEDQRQMLNAERKENIDLANKLRDPNSEESRQRRLAYGKVLGVKIPDEMSATDLENPQVLNSINQQKMMSMRASGSGKGEAKEKIVPLKDRKLSQDERQLLNNSALAYKAIFDMEDAIRKGVNKRTLVGDNDYTYAQNRFVEGIGRMQSGGAIGKEETENFKRLIPGMFDGKDLTNKKIKDMKLELEARLKSIGFEPKEVLESRTYGQDEISPTERSQAIDWATANQNSKDPETRRKAMVILGGK